MDGELWRSVPGYVGLYEVSDAGRVRSTDRVVTGPGGHPKRIRGRVLRQNVIKVRRSIVHLSREGTRTAFLVHRLILISFVGPAPEGTVCCHNDGNSQNNRLSNLRWDTPSNNQLDSVKHGTHPEASRTHCVNGHEFSPANTYFNPNPQRTGRTCRACIRAYQAQYQARKRFALAKSD
jgi:hypothetical protein